MAGEKSYNPVQAQRKAEKAKAIKKGKAEVQNRRNEKLAQKNPNRIQKQIDDLKAVATSGGKLSKHEEEVLAGLERDLKAVNRARESLGDRAPTFGRGWNRDRDGEHGQQAGVLGKRRRRGDDDASSGDDDVPEDVRRIPMPRDTPPPIPKEVLDEWYAKRRARRDAEQAERQGDGSGGGSGQAPSRQNQKQKQEAPAVESKTVYSAAPVTRDLRKEAVAAFVPTAVKMKMDKGKGQGGLMEPEEADRLEREGYLKLQQDEASTQPRHATVTMEEVDDEEA